VLLEELPAAAIAYFVQLLKLLHYNLPRGVSTY